MVSAKCVMFGRIQLGTYSRFPTEVLYSHIVEFTQNSTRRI